MRRKWERKRVNGDENVGVTSKCVRIGFGMGDGFCAKVRSMRKRGEY